MNLKIGIHNFPPVTKKTGQVWSGFEVELWEEVAKRLNLDFTYFEVENFDRLLKNIEKSEFDLAIAGITRTVSRSEKMQMSFLTLDTGLIVGIYDDKKPTIGELLHKIFSRGTIGVMSVLVGFSLVIAHGYWFIERSYSVSEKYATGIFESFWWAFVTFSTIGYGDISPETLFGKIFALISIAAGLALFGLFIAQLSSALTLGKLKHEIRSVDDLVGKKVAVKKGTTAIETAIEHGAIINEFETVDLAVASLIDKSSDAVIADSASLQNIKNIKGLFLVGGLFSRQSYSFAAPKKSRLLKKINTTLIAIREDETYDRIYAKYFK